MEILGIVLATALAGVGSVWVAAGLMRWRVFSQREGVYCSVGHLLSLAAGALLATSFLHALPLALESSVAADTLCLVLLVGLVFFFLLEKVELWHHGHEHHHDDHEAHDHHHHPSTRSWTLLMGDSVHCFGDGMLVAWAFMADAKLGLVAALAVLAHEVPHHMGDLAVLRQGADRSRAVLKVSLAGAITPIGGLVGYGLGSALAQFSPYFLVIAASSFIYVALADLIPQLQKRLTLRETAVQIAWLLLGIGLVVLTSHLVPHSH